MILMTALWEKTQPRRNFTWLNMFFEHLLKSIIVFVIWGSDLTNKIERYINLSFSNLTGWTEYEKDRNKKIFTPLNLFCILFNRGQKSDILPAQLQNFKNNFVNKDTWIYWKKWFAWYLLWFYNWVKAALRSRSLAWRANVGETEEGKNHNSGCWYR